MGSGAGLRIEKTMEGHKINHFLSLVEERERGALQILKHFQIQEQGDKILLLTTSEEHGRAVMTLLGERLKELSGKVHVVVRAGANGNGKAKPEIKTFSEGLSGRYTFENFIVGEGNRVAYDVAVSVAKEPGNAFNPFFIYGGVGLGKTHLLHAIGNLCHSKGLRVIYKSANDFSEEMVNNMKEGTISQFRDKYRNTDVLLLDDIQFLSGKGRTQVEFFNIFNFMYLREKQIILASDRHPRDLKDVSERLISRFEGGVVVEIEIDQDTKERIIYSKLKENSLEISPRVVEEILARTGNNVREIEGAIRTLKMGGRLTQPKKIKACSDFSLIMEAVASYFGYEVSDLLKNRGSRRISKAKYLAMFLCRKLTGASLIEIARAFNKRDHSTVIYGIRKVEEEIRRDRKFAYAVDFLEKKVSKKLTS